MCVPYSSGVDTSSAVAERRWDIVISPCVLSVHDVSNIQYLNLISPVPPEIKCSLSFM